MVELLSEIQYNLFKCKKELNDLLKNKERSITFSQLWEDDEDYEKMYYELKDKYVDLCQDIAEGKFKNYE